MDIASDSGSLSLILSIYSILSLIFQEILNIVCLVSLIVCAGDKIARPVLADDSSPHYLSCITLHDNNTTSLFQHYKTNGAHSDLIFPIIPFLSKSHHISKTLRLYSKFYFPDLFSK